SEGPLKLWHTDEMAEYNGKRLRNELEKEEPDPEQLKLYTVGLGSAVDDMYDKGEVSKDFNPEESWLDEYVNTVLRQMDADSLAKLGGMGDGDGGGKGSDPDSLTAAQRAVANGINATMNPDVGGSDPLQCTSPELAGGQTGVKTIPPGVRDFIYGDYAEKLSERGTGRGSGLRSDLKDFNAFGELMSQATKESGVTFSKDMAQTGLDVQKIVEEKNQEIAGRANKTSNPPIDVPLVENH